MAPWDSPPLVITISSLTKTSAHREHLRLIQNLDLDMAIAYTDGSLSKSNMSSIGFVIYKPFTRELTSYSFNLGNSMGINNTETYCIYKALKRLKKELPNARYQIFSDSQASLQRIMGKTNYYSHKIQSLAKGCSLSIIWCPAHVGIDGHELADSLARGAIQKTA